MYDVGCTMYDLKACARCAMDAERMRSGILKAMRGFGREGVVMYDVRGTLLRRHPIVCLPFGQMPTHLANPPYSRRRFCRI